MEVGLPTARRRARRVAAFGALLLLAACGGKGLRNRDAGDAASTEAGNADAGNAQPMDASADRPATGDGGTGGADAGGAADTGAVCQSPTSADCTAEPGCETSLGTANNCAGCSDGVCNESNTLLACRSADGCAHLVCEPGYANCDTTSLNCETTFYSGYSGGACLPSLSGVSVVAGDFLDIGAAIGSDGSYFIAGRVRGSVDFDPTAGQDLYDAPIATAIASFITKLNPDGSYGWTRVFGEATLALGGRQGVAATAGGGVAVVGVFSGSVDLDPGPGVDLHQTAPSTQNDGVVLKLAGDGTVIWARTFAGAASDANSGLTGVAVDATDAVYLASSYNSTVDFDPGPSTAARTAAAGGGAVVKLTAAGAFSWVQSISNGPCQMRMGTLAVASDGVVWALAEVQAEPSCAFGTPSAPQYAYSPLVAAYGPGGDARGTWTLPPRNPSVFFNAIAAGPAGSVYIGGEGSGVADLDPGPGVARRWIGNNGGFVLKLASDASLLWAVSAPPFAVTALAPAPDGGLLATGGLPPFAVVTRMSSDGTPRWTFTMPTGIAPPSVATRGNGIFLAGAAERANNGDLDPGPGTATFDGTFMYLSRFSF